MNASTLPTLHELGDARSILDEWLVETEGDVTPEIGELWEKLDGDIDTKIERWGLWAQERAGHAKQIREEEQRLADRRHAIENAVERSKAELMRQMQKLGKAKVNGLLCTVAIQQNSATSVTTERDAVELWALEDARPFVKREEKVVYTLDREAILAARKNGQALPASIVVERGFHLRIK